MNYNMYQHMTIYIDPHMNHMLCCYFQCMLKYSHCTKLELIQQNLYMLMYMMSMMHCYWQMLYKHLYIQHYNSD